MQVANKKEKINTSTLAPYQLIESLQRNEDKKVINLQLEEILKNMKEKLPDIDNPFHPSNCIAVADTSVMKNQSLRIYYDLE